MSKAGALLWRTIFETNDARRLAKQAQDTSDLSIERDIAYSTMGTGATSSTFTGCPTRPPTPRWS